MLRELSSLISVTSSELSNREMWYDRLARLAMEEHGEKIAKGVALPVKVKQNFKPVKASDIYAMATAVAGLYGNGMGILAKYPEFAFDMMGWEQKSATGSAC